MWEDAQPDEGPRLSQIRKTGLGKGRLRVAGQEKR